MDHWSDGFGKAQWAKDLGGFSALQYSNTPLLHVTCIFCQGVAISQECIDLESGVEAGYSELSSTVTFWLPPLFLAR